MPLVQVLYVSSARPAVTADDVAEILASSRRRNMAAGVTGMLLYCGDNFLQILEGEEGPVDETLRRIGRDSRHSNLQTLIREAISSPAFGDWSMGFENLNAQSDDDPAAAFEIGRAEIERHLAARDAWRVRHFMETFYRINTRRELSLRRA